VRATFWSERWRIRVALFFFVLLGLALRLWGIGYGLPNVGVRPDEEQVVGAADAWLRFGEWPPRIANYPTLPMHVDAAALWVTSVVGRALGLFEDHDDFLARGPALHYRIGRLVSALFGVATILATSSLARRFSGHRAAPLLAALALATLYLHVRDSHFSTVDVPAGLFTTLALLFSLRALETDRAPPWLLAGLATGLAGACKYNAPVVFLSLIAAAVLRVRDGARPTLIARRLAAAALIAGVAFALASPSTLVRLRETLGALRVTRHLLYDSQGELGLLVHAKETLPVGFGEILCGATLIGTARRWRDRRMLVLLAFVVPTFAAAAAARLVFPRYLVTLAPPLAVVASDAVLTLLGSSRLALAAAGLALVGPGLARSVAYDRLAARPDTRLLVADWVERRYRPGTRVLLCYGWGQPELQTRTRIVDCRNKELPFDWAAVIITSRHPVLGRWMPVAPELLAVLQERARPVAVFDPFRPDRSAYFYVGDAFYLPFSGLTAMERGGPAFTVWELSEAPLRRRSKGLAPSSEAVGPTKTGAADTNPR
jgi:Dolichyl-phosphate-mannose-protein mannosyltransferase